MPAKPSTAASPAKTPVALLLALGLAAAGLREALPEETVASEQPADEGETIIVPRNAKVADLTIKTTLAEHIIQLVNQALAERPQNTKARVVLHRVFTNYPAHYGVQAYPHAVVPLNDKGEPDGTETFYDVHSGCRMYRKVPWKDGKRHGEEKLYAGDQVKAVIPWVDNKIQGVRKAFYADGKLQMEAAYRNGVADGPTRSYTPAGALMREESHKDGKRHGMARDFWAETGKPRREIEYDMGKVVGVAREYYADGRLKRELPFKDNAMHGVEVQYEADGTVTRRCYWLEGRKVTQEDYGKAAGKGEGGAGGR
jgi:antitoxin component YwqK of YwqJK toxin-antitoxin module